MGSGPHQSWIVGILNPVTNQQEKYHVECPTWEQAYADVKEYIAGGKPLVLVHDKAKIFSQITPIRA